MSSARTGQTRRKLEGAWLAVLALASATSCLYSLEPPLEPGDASAESSPESGGDETDPVPSCANLSWTCGANEELSCCSSFPVPGGTFARSYDGLSYKDKGFPAQVSDFQLDAFEVTVGRFRKFVEAWPGSRPAPGAGAHPAAGAGWDSAWDSYLPADVASWNTALSCDSKFQTWSEVVVKDYELRPINCLSWYDAFAFCAWDGGRLPTEAEWNYAASGGDEQRAYPWSAPPTSTEVDPQHASYFLEGSPGCKECCGDGITGCSVDDLIAVGTRPQGRGRWGQGDLAGNVMEWVLDYYAEKYPLGPCHDCVNLAPGQLAARSARGGAYNLLPDTLLSSYRLGANPANRYATQGVRCARAP